ncbi:MAG TPA: TylF/MycF/NovP-related O-methyltransferase [Pseudolabrys sp.]
MPSQRDSFYYPSSGEEACYSKLRTLTERFPHDLRHYLDLFSVYASRRAFIRQLAHYELFKRTIDLPGHYADFGVYFGKSYFSWHKFLEVLTPTATHKKVIGFDTFAGFPALAREDGEDDTSIQKVPGGLSAASFIDEFLELLALHNADAVLPVERGRIVQGDVCKTLPRWLEDNQEARFCLINLDVDIYEPTMVILENCWDRVVSGGVVILDEYATSKWPGETKAWDDFALRRGLRLTLSRFPWANAPGAYVIKA